jgi:arylsulfatase A
MDALEKSGIADRTLVIFTSDNGTTLAGSGTTRFNVGGVDAAFFNSTAGLRAYKGSVYEGGIRVPMIARLPGKIPAGSVNDVPCYFADWFPTLCDAVGLDKTGEIDGETMWPMMTGGKAVPRTKPMLWVFPQYGGQVAVRIGDYKIVRQKLAEKNPGNWEVYNLAKDIGEKTDIALEKADLIRQAERLLRSEVSDNTNFPVKIPSISN